MGEKYLSTKSFASMFGMTEEISDLCTAIGGWVMLRAWMTP